jgi:radical SAM superfamily enzyme YgiQ (UPF0313 family)
LFYIHPKRIGASNKDVAGGFGSVTSIGDSVRARIIQRKKKRGDRLPLLSYALYSAIFRQNGHNVTFHENEIPIGKDLVVIHGSIIDYKQEVAFAQKIKRHPENKNTRICFVGPFVTFHAEYFMEYGDTVIKGEPDHYFLNNDIQEFEDGIVISETIKDLDVLPFSDWSIFDVSTFSYSPLNTHTPFLTIQSSRGCPFSCSHYCPYTYYQGTKLRERSAESVAAEIEDMKMRYGIKGLLFRDPLFGVDADSLEKLCNKLAQLDVYWSCETRLDLLSEDRLKMMRNAGLVSLNVGIESNNEESLKKFKRRAIKKDRQEGILSICDKLNVKVAAFYMLGLPTDTEGDVRKTIAYSKRLNTFAAQYSISIPYPGTPYYEQVKDTITTDDFEDFTTAKLVTEHKYLTADQLQRLREYAYTSYYFRPRYAAKYLKYRVLDAIT